MTVKGALADDPDTVFEVLRSNRAVWVAELLVKVWLAVSVSSDALVGLGVGLGLGVGVELGGGVGLGAGVLETPPLPHPVSNIK